MWIAKLSLALLRQLDQATLHQRHGSGRPGQTGVPDPLFDGDRTESPDSQIGSKRRCDPIDKTNSSTS